MCAQGVMRVTPRSGHTNCSVVDESRSSLAGLGARCVSFYQTSIYLSIYLLQPTKGKGVSKAGRDPPVVERERIAQHHLRPEGHLVRVRVRFRLGLGLVLG